MGIFQESVDKRLEVLEEKKKFSTAAILDRIHTGQLPQDFLNDIKLHGVNEINEELRFWPLFEQACLFVSELRISRKYLSGASQFFKTAVCSQLNAWLTQRQGLRGLWSFPKARTLELLSPRQHKPLLRHWAKINGIKTITREMLTSNTTFDVGFGSATFTHLNSGKQDGGAAAGTAVVAVTADYAIAEEASQSSQAEILPLYRRLDASRIQPTQPVIQLGTPGAGGGIESAIANATYEFWPHAYCPHCGDHMSLHPKGALLRPVLVIQDDGTPVERYAGDDGLPLNWYRHVEHNPIETAYIGCPECGHEFSVEARNEAVYRCVNTGMMLDYFLEEYVPNHWEDERIEAGMWAGALARPNKPHLARDIMEEMSIEGIEDWYQQRLGISSSAMSNTVSPEALVAACNRPPLKVLPKEHRVRLIGVDQGRSAWYASVVDFIYDKELIIPELMYMQSKRNIITMDCISAHELPDYCKKHKVQGGFVDNEPTIELAARLSKQAGLRIADQQLKLKDDFKAKMINEGGEKYFGYSIRYTKFARAIFTLFNTSRVSANRQFLRYAQGSTKDPGNVFKHLTRISWNNEEGDIVRPPDKVDDLFFALMFAEAAFGVFTVSPSLIMNVTDWEWLKKIR
jgi:hypothetical protein